MATKKKPDVLTAEELLGFQQGGPFYVPGRAYVWTLSYGWCVVGFYVGHENPLTIRVAHANYGYGYGCGCGCGYGSGYGCGYGSGYGY